MQEFFKIIMADKLQDGSEVVDFQKDNLIKELFNKTNTKQHANLEIFWFST